MNLNMKFKVLPLQIIPIPVKEGTKHKFPFQLKEGTKHKFPFQLKEGKICTSKQFLQNFKISKKKKEKKNISKSCYVELRFISTKM